ncbi:MAG: phasin family protein [Candidatus Competibacteraceae bacterium]|nr:phasin family protein [Candidatus Competibacteraceae bacterium]
MTAKLQNEANQGEPVNVVMSTANQIWLAGLGAFAVAQQEGGRLFDILVNEGEEFETQTMKKAGERVEKVKEKVEGVREKATDQLDKLEHAFQKRVARALNRLGVPTDEDISDLSKRVEALNKTIQQLKQRIEPTSVKQRSELTA